MIFYRKITIFSKTKYSRDDCIVRTCVHAEEKIKHLHNDDGTAQRAVCIPLVMEAHLGNAWDDIKFGYTYLV